MLRNRALSMKRSIVPLYIEENNSSILHTGKLDLYNVLTTFSINSGISEFVWMEKEPSFDQVTNENTKIRSLPDQIQKFVWFEEELEEEATTEYLTSDLRNLRGAFDATHPLLK